MTDDVNGLVERLRAYRSLNEWGDAGHHSICDEAATALVSLSKERDEALDEDWVARSAFETAIAEAYGFRSRAEAAEQRVQKVEGLLTAIIGAHENNSGAEPSASVLERAIDSARAAIKEQP